MGRVLTLCALLLALAAAAWPAAARADRLDQVLAPWLDRQTPEGAFTDWADEKVGGGGGYAESMLGLALATQGLQTGNAAMSDAGARALNWAIDHPAMQLAGRQSVFEDLALATALDTLGPKLAPDLRDRLKARVLGTLIVRGVGTRYSNHSLTEALRVLTAAHAGVGLATDDALHALTVLGGSAPHYARLYRQTTRGVTASVFSDPAANPIAYHALTLAFLARAADLLGASTPPGLRLTIIRMAEGSATLMAPDGDVAYWGRSQEESWALPYTAYGAQVAARLAPRTAPRMRLLAQRAMARFDARHLDASGLLLTPSQAQPADDPRAGLDAYASRPAYTGLTALGLSWLDPAFATGPTSPLTADADGAALVSNRASTFATVRSGTRWWAVKLRPAHAHSDDGRTDFGLIAFKSRRADGSWRDTLPLRPFDLRTACARGACATPPPTLGPAAVTSAGLARPVGDDLVRGTGTRRRWVTVTGRWVKPDGTTFAPLKVTYRPDVRGVRVTWDAFAGQAFQVGDLFDGSAGPVCAAGTAIGNASASLTVPAIESPVLTTGLASGSTRPITAATVTVRAAATGPLTVVYGDAGVACPAG